MKNNHITRSIIVPFRNSEVSISFCLDSLLRQNMEEVELIMVDNNSDDNSRDIVLSYQKKFPNFKYIFEPTIGRGAARNSGIKNAIGDVILMTDSDCVVPDNWVKNISNLISDKKELVVMGGEYNLSSGYFSKMRQAYNEKYLQNKIHNAYVNHLDTKNFAISSSLIKRMMFDDSLKAYEDYDLYLRLRAEGIKIRYLKDIKVGHFHNDSINSLYKTQKDRGYNLAKIRDKHRKHINSAHFIEDESLKSAKFINFVLFLPWAISRIFLSPKKAVYEILADLFWKIGLINYLIKRD